ncbi:hypothetical protein MCOR07_006313 [Pyricularia oryzae]|uniref:Uncharacterized protein n=1 Tax=Pyricularia grisea TaxID=148305 RepID=A0ABQ8N2D8_PYRGI|nr:hypothetical protein MCOR33_011522 [Pyricularia grisea]KAI6338779.1 hypothetical protein MCOR28_007707 [Pyricularia oryzae]KAI6427361.1 hypothetical protein MCOR21_006155 [Pyricularia oryzae]KAI6509916.1 hypothetical protein MCOR10_010536 [Pyricularia oryzae]KAI6618823.1 hypothetical protein MCOR07_006313 [Pyricularia oryzae]
MVTFTQLFTTFLSVTAVAAVTTHYPAKDRVMIFLSRSDEQPVHARMRLHDLETHYMKDPDFGWKATGYDVLEKQGSWAWLISSKHNGNIELAKKRLAVMGYWDETYSWGQNPDGSSMYVATAFKPTTKLPEQALAATRSCYGSRRSQMRCFLGGSRLLWPGLRTMERRLGLNCGVWSLRDIQGLELHHGILQNAWNPCQLLFGNRRTAQLRWRALVCIGPGSSRCQYGEQPLQMNKIEGPGGKSIFFPVFFLPFWLFYCIRKDQPLTTDLVWGLRILESLLTAERLTSKYSVACSAHMGVGIGYLMFASFLQGWRISVGDSEFWGLRNKGYTNTQVYLDARGTLTKILGVALPPAGLSGPQCGNGPRAELHPRLAEGCSKLK